MLKIRNISDKNNVSLDLICSLQSVSITYDEIGNSIETQVSRIVYCAELSIYSSEFFNAGQKGIKPEIMLVIDLEEYDREELLLYNDITYSIYRSYPRSDGLIELYCKED